MEKSSPEVYEKYFAALMEISNAVISDRYLEDILKLIVLVTARATGFEICSLWMIEKDKKETRIRLKTTQAINQDYVEDRTLKIDEGVVGFVATRKQPLIIKNVLQEPLFKEKEMASKIGLVAMLGVPLQVGNNEVIGVLNCFTDKPHDFSETEVNLITTVANQAALAIQNTKLAVDASVIKEELETRKQVEKAREVLIKNRNLSNDDAFRWIQKKSMDTRRSMREISEAILLAEELA